MTNFIPEQHEHGQCLIIFEGSKAIKRLDELKNKYKKCFVIEDKTKTRLKSMVESCASIAKHHHNLMYSAITTLQTAMNLSEMMAIQLGIIEPSEMQGFVICPACLQQAMIACEEVLSSLKDIEEATKEYI